MVLVIFVCTAGLGAYENDTCHCARNSGVQGMGHSHAVVLALPFGANSGYLFAAVETGRQSKYHRGCCGHDRVCADV